MAFFAVSVKGQNNVTYLTPAQLKEQILTSKKPAVVQFWIPNCASANETITEYKLFEEKYGKEIDFYFIGITNKESLVTDLIKKSNYAYPIYIADTTVDKNINERQGTFCEMLGKEFAKKFPKDFITLFLDKKGNITYVGDRVFIKEEQLTHLLRK